MTKWVRFPDKVWHTVGDKKTDVGMPKTECCDVAFYPSHPGMFSNHPTEGEKTCTQHLSVTGRATKFPGPLHTPRELRAADAPTRVSTDLIVGAEMLVLQQVRDNFNNLKDAISLYTPKLNDDSLDLLIFAFDSSSGEALHEMIGYDNVGAYRHFYWLQGFSTALGLTMRELLDRAGVEL